MATLREEIDDMRRFYWDNHPKSPEMRVLHFLDKAIEALWGMLDDRDAQLNRCYHKEDAEQILALLDK